MAYGVGSYGPGDASLSKEQIDALVKGFALQRQVVLQVMAKTSVRADSYSYYAETATELNAAAEVGRNVRFPADTLEHRKTQTYMEKHGLEVEIPWEDLITNNVDLEMRNVRRVATAITKSVNDAAYAAMLAGVGNTVTIPTAGNAHEWDAATRADRHPGDHIAQAINNIEKNNYIANFIMVDPHDYGYLVFNDDLDGTYSEGAAANRKTGMMGLLGGLQVIKTNSVTEDSCLVGSKNVCATWAEVTGLRTEVIDDPGVKRVIRGWQMGKAIVTDANALCKIDNTRD